MVIFGDHAVGFVNVQLEPFSYEWGAVPAAMLPNPAPIIP
jgi:hypothetical protein